MNRLILIVLFFQLTNSSKAQFTELWTNEFNGEVNGIESVYKISLDTNGNIYTLGNRISKLFLSKHDKFGNLLWRKTNLHEDLYLRGFEMDSLMNFYIFGTKILKCDSFGNMVDSSDFSFIPNFNQLSSVVKGKNHFYLVATALVGSDYRIQAVKLDFNFNVIWQRNYNSSFDDYSSQILLDSMENVYITGSSAMNNGDILVLKYDSAGVFKWTKNYNNNTFNDIDQVYDSELDLNGNLILTGVSYKAYPDIDRITIKFDGLGNQLWLNDYNDSTCFYPVDEGYLIVTDENNYIYSIGKNYCNGINVSKISPLGNLIWSVDRDFELNRVYDVVFDSENNLVISCRGTTNNHIAIQCFDTSGVFLWDKVISGTQSSNNDKPTDLEFNKTDSLIVAGGYMQHDSTSRDGYLVCFKDSLQIWNDEYNDSGNLYDSNYFIDTNSIGEIYIFGHSIFNINDSSFITKLDVNGNLIWHKNIKYDEIGLIGFHIDLNENFYFLSRPNDTTIVQKYSSNLNLLWENQFSGFSGYYFDEMNYLYGTVDSLSGSTKFLRNIRIDTMGIVSYYNALDEVSSDYGIYCQRIIPYNNFNYIIGGKVDQFDFYSGFIVKTDLNGNFIWIDSIHSATNSFYITDISISSNGIYLIGSNSYNAYDYDSVFIKKIDHLGNEIWLNEFLSLSPTNAYIQLKIFESDNGKIFFVNEDNYDNSINIYSVFSNGTLDWSVNHLNTIETYTNLSLKTDLFNNLLVFNGSYEILVVSPYGQEVFNYSTGIFDSYEYGNKQMVIWKNSNDFYIFGGVLRPYYYNVNAIIKLFKYSDINTTNIHENSIIENIFIFPNPTFSEFQVSIPSNKPGNIFIYNIEGKLVLNNYLNIPIQTIEINLPSGLYSVIFENDEERFSSKVLVLD